MPSASGSSSAARRAAVVYNPIKIDVGAVRAAVATAEREAGWQTTLWFETSKEDAGQEVTKKALEQGADMIIAAGGDGTVRGVAEAMHDSEASLALLPSGTGNLLARNLKLTLENLDNSLHTAFSGDDRAIDLGLIDIRREDDSVTKHVYVVMAGLGIDARMLANTDADLKKRVGWLAYAKALVTTLLEKNSLNFRYSFDEKPARSMRANTIIIGNCGALPANILLLPDAAIDDGLFDVLLLRPESVLGWLKILYKVFWENGVIRRLPFADKLKGTENEELRYVKVKSVTVKLRDAEDIEIDGDGFGKAVGFRTRVKPGGLTVRVPKG
ncbi:MULTISPECIES: diacylglycerol kinase family protein [unclassified Frondihabitans]|uniref:diacylglycerol/lipid kinase family protein n=1 Tax=unclassified Frondihabitans TaxID=2626248 RepID=UPI000F4ECFBF|nr:MULTISPECIES: diacylglycerol kinase family protein [unclassified Frondihabitans]RPE74267.1 diacylglycerol kinase family enzyme [Frondihabitans sp. PhB153]RPF02696.1 diacylglycerol kinase family enzyme [Frondihabitans sp. PhB161]